MNELDRIKERIKRMEPGPWAGLPVQSRCTSTPGRDKAPAAMEQIAGSIGWQQGRESTKVILSYMLDRIACTALDILPDNIDCCKLAKSINQAINDKTGKVQEEQQEAINVKASKEWMQILEEAQTLELALDAVDLYKQGR